MEVKRVFKPFGLLNMGAPIPPVPTGGGPMPPRFFGESCGETAGALLTQTPSYSPTGLPGRTPATILPPGKKASRGGLIGLLFWGATSEATVDSNQLNEFWGLEDPSAGNVIRRLRNVIRAMQNIGWPELKVAIDLSLYCPAPGVYKPYEAVFPFCREAALADMPLHVLIAGDFTQGPNFNGGNPWVPNRPPSSLWQARTDAFNHIIDFAQRTYSSFGGDLRRLSFGVDVEPESVFAPYDPSGLPNEGRGGREFYQGWWGDRGVPETYGSLTASNYHDMLEYVVPRLIKPTECKLRSPSMTASAPRTTHPISDEIPALVGSYVYPSYFDEWSFTIYDTTLQDAGPSAGPYEHIQAARERLIYIRDLYRTTTAFDIYKKDLVIDECFASPGTVGMGRQLKPLRTYEYGRNYIAGMLDMVDQVGGFSKVYWFTMLDGVAVGDTDPYRRYGFFSISDLNVYPSLAGIAVASGAADRYDDLASLNQNPSVLPDNPVWTGFGDDEYRDVSDLN
jgi:hypothetical protein